MGESFFIQFDIKLVAEIFLVIQSLVAQILVAHKDGSRVIVLFVHIYG
jgi:hypothetical protein